MKVVLKKFIVVLLSVCIVLSSLVFGAASADIARYGRSKLQGMDNSQSLLFAYDKIAEGCKNSQTNISVSDASHSISRDELATVMRFIEADYPEFFWMEGGYSYSLNASDKIKSVTPTYIMGGIELENARVRFDDAVEKLTAGLSSRSDYKKAKILHDRLAVLTNYYSGGNRYNSYGALVDGKAVCEGYSRAYQVLLNEVGIQAWTVTGKGVDSQDGSQVDHAWNLVRLAEDWYYTDVTWDDYGNKATDIFYCYFNITTARLLENHILDEAFARVVPLCTAQGANYFTVNGGRYVGFDSEQLTEQIRSGGTVVRLYTTGDTAQFRNEVSAGIASAAAQAGLPGSISCTVKYCHREMLVILTLNSCSHSCDRVWSYNDEYHWRTCTCRTVFDYDFHKDDNFDGSCDSCGYVLSHRYTLVYDANGGIGAPAAQTGGSTMVLSSVIPVRSGYIFLGWSASPDSVGASYNPGQSIAPVSDMTLYAVWYKNNSAYYSLSYNANGGVGIPATQVGSISYTVSTDAPVREGYTFLGWSELAYASEPTYQAGDVIIPQSNMVLYAVWAQTQDDAPEQGVSDLEISIRTPSVSEICYGDMLILHADVNGEMPEGAKIRWKSNSSAVNMFAQDDSRMCSVKSVKSGDIRITATIVNAANEPLLDENGEELSDYIVITSKAGFIYKLLSFFKSLFGISRTILQTG